MARGIRDVNGLCCVGGSTGTGVSLILTVSTCGGVELNLFPGLISPSAVMGPVADCVEVGLGG